MTILTAWNRKTDLIGYSLSVLNIAMLHSKESREIAEGSLKAILENKDYGDTIACTLFDANLIAGTDMRRLLNFCYSRPDRPDLIVKLLTEIGRDCGSWYSAEDIEEEGKKGFISHDLPHMVKESLDYIESHGYMEAGASLALSEAKREIGRLFKKERYEEAVEEIFNATDALLKAGKEGHGEGAFYVRENGRDRPQQNISVINAFRDTVKTAPDGFRGFIARNTLSVFTRLVEYRGLIGLNVDRMDGDEILHAFLQERGAYG